VVLSTANAEQLLAIAARHGVPARVIGAVTGASAGLRITAGAATLAITTARMAEAYHEALPRAMQRAAAEAVTHDPALEGAQA